MRWGFYCYSVIIVHSLEHCVLLPMTDDFALCHVFSRYLCGVSCVTAGPLYCGVNVLLPVLGTTWFSPSVVVAVIM
jgi:hypothetical protein